MVISTPENAADLFCVVYRTGGTVNFQWKRTLPTDKATAHCQQADTARMGYKATVVNYAASLASGLPEGWEAK